MDNARLQHIRPIVFSVLLALSLHARADQRVSVGGFVKHFSVVFDAAETGRFFGMPNRRLGLSSTRWRTEAAWGVQDFVRVQLAYDAVARIQDPELFASAEGLGFQTAGDYRLTDTDGYLLNPESGGAFGVLQNLDRLFLFLRLGPADVTAGRQAVAWGSARTVNPTDVIAPFSFESLDTENRRGVDAVRVRIPIGWMGEADAGYLWGDADRSWTDAAYLRGKAYLCQTDVSLILIRFQGHGMVGWDLARAVGGAGAWLETAAVFPGAFRGTSAGNDTYWRVTAGADYNFSGGLYGFVEYHFNGAGADDPARYLGLPARSAYRDGKVYLLGRHYGFLGGQYPLNPLWTIHSEILFNMTDGSVMTAPGVRYNAARNVDLSLGVFWGWGDPPRSASVLPQPKSEFGLYPDFAYLSFQYYY